MSRQTTESISPRLWRITLVSCAAMAACTLLAMLLIGAQDRSNHARWTAAAFDERWMIQAGSQEPDRLVLRPAASAIGLALHPVETEAFALQARVTLDDAAGSAGLIVQAADADHFSAFLISSDGYFRFSDFRNGMWIDRVAWRAWPHIRRESAVNLLRAECAASTCTFFVNDEWTLQVEDVPVTRWLGFVAPAPESEAAFKAHVEQVEWQP